MLQAGPDPLACVSMLLRLPSSPARPFLHKLLNAGLEAADPYQALIKTVSLNGASLRVGQQHLIFPTPKEWLQSGPVRHPQEWRKH